MRKKGRNPKRGRCPVCGFRWPLNKEGLLRRHKLYGIDWHHCKGAGEPPKTEGGADVEGPTAPFPLVFS